MNDLKINSVKLVNSGLKGIVVTYAQASEKNTRSFIDEHVSKKKAPIHEELETGFESLREPLLEICGYPDPSAVVNDVEVTGITYSDRGFIITGKYKILGGDKMINLVTPIIRDGEEYEGFAPVAVIMDNIYEEVKSYMSGAKVFSDEKLVLKFNSDKEDFDQETFKKLSKIEQRDFATKILEGFNSIVYHIEEEIEEEEAVVPVAETPIVATMDVVNDETVIAEEEDFDLPKEVVAKPAKTSNIKMVTEPNGGFKIVAEPMGAKASTAKKIKTA